MSNTVINFNKNFFLNNGYLVIKNFLSVKQINKIKTDLKVFIKKNRKKFNNIEINTVKGNEINSLHNMNNFIHSVKLKKNKKLIKIVENLLNKKVKEMGSELFAKPPKIGLSSPIHQDNYYWCLERGDAVTAWIAIDNSSKKNGGIFYYCGSHKDGLFQHKKSFSPGSSQTIRNKNLLKKYKVAHPNLKNGDCLIHHCMVIHGSASNKSKYSRRGLTVRFKSINDYKNKLRHNKYLKELKDQVNRRKLIKHAN